MERSYIDGEQQDEETEQAVSHMLKSSDEQTTVSSSSGISVSESGMDDPLDLFHQGLSPEPSLADTLRIHYDNLLGQLSRHHTPKSLTRMMQEHRENERHRHHSLNFSIQEISSRVPCAEKSTNETKIVKMQRTISYICHLENHIQKLLESHKLKINFKNLFLSPNMRKPFDANVVKEHLKHPPSPTYPQYFHKHRVVRKPPKVVGTSEENPSEDLTEDCEDPLQAFDEAQQAAAALVPEFSDFTHPDLTSKVSHEIELENYVENSLGLDVQGSNFIHGEHDSPISEPEDSDQWSAVAPNDLYEKISNEISSPTKAESGGESDDKENESEAKKKIQKPGHRSSLRNVTSLMNVPGKEADKSTCHEDCDTSIGLPICSSDSSLGKSGSRRALQDATQRMRNKKKYSRFCKFPKMSSANPSPALRLTYCPGKTMSKIVTNEETLKDFESCGIVDVTMLLSVWSHKD
ncbi:hypothetical protein CAPTEDRAFT_193552 [Capitella teleta]|uniref:BHLH domain-containing protein n=1 Tax=Capitella teleta TaxID=283909 RepID=R7TSH8_CAPTE|nr:hypothetical protein CAPTEDRAFT_193552 [Capitella teleta]|eukprot:ELT93985.1 hypothetical protein CAPTEDRAFT_193552 [Capitella teleta]